MNKQSIIEKYGLLISFIVVITIWLGSLYWIFYPQWSAEKDHVMGTLGDSFGILNTLFSGLAFAGLVYTIYLQKKELKETRDVFIEQSKIFQQQRFDDSFYKMIDLLQSTRTEMLKVSIGYNEISFFENIYHNINGCDQTLKDAALIEEISKQFSFRTSRSLYSRYYRTFMTILKLIVAKHKEINLRKEDYNAILISQMDSFEVSIMLIYSVQNVEFQKILIDVGLLDRVTFFKMVDKKFHRLFDVNQIPEKAK
jgi:hypothetical protein